MHAHESGHSIVDSRQNNRRATGFQSGQRHPRVPEQPTRRAFTASFASDRRSRTRNEEMVPDGGWIESSVTPSVRSSTAGRRQLARVLAAGSDRRPAARHRRSVARARQVPGKPWTIDLTTDRTRKPYVAIENRRDVSNPVRGSQSSPIETSPESAFDERNAARHGRSRTESVATARYRSAADRPRSRIDVRPSLSNCRVTNCRLRDTALERCPFRRRPLRRTIERRVSRLHHEPGRERRTRRLDRRVTGVRHAGVAYGDGGSHPSERTACPRRTGVVGVVTRGLTPSEW